jgi:NAD(P)-dependent dehydrogenase (short-subunit alcohol dehydrogenase family)
VTLKDPFSIEDKVTIITGGGTGIGASIAHEFASRGARLLIASRKLSHLEPVRDEIRKAGGKCEMAQCDVRDPAACEETIATAVRHFGRLDVLINNHGGSIAARSLDLSPNGWGAVVGINLNGTFFASKAAARQFIKQNTGGVIINMSTYLALRATPMAASYAAAKAAVINLTKSHASEWGGFGIRVNCIVPGPIETEAAAARGWGNPDLRAKVGRTRALGRLGRVGEIAYPCIFLASDAASYISGAMLVIDGGTAPRGE